jgi:hypothetical protein
MRAFARQRTPINNRRVVIYFVWMASENPETYPFVIEAVKGIISKILRLYYYYYY